MIQPVIAKVFVTKVNECVRLIDAYDTLRAAYRYGDAELDAVRSILYSRAKALHEEYGAAKDKGVTEAMSEAHDVLLDCAWVVHFTVD